MCRAREAAHPAVDLHEVRVRSPSIVPAHDADADAFDREHGALRIDDDRGEGRICRKKPQVAAAPFEALDGDLVAGDTRQARDDDLSRAGLSALVDGEQIPIENTGVAH